MFESQEFNDSHTPLAYLITFRSYGNWLHGDKRGPLIAFTIATERLVFPRISVGRSTSSNCGSGHQLSSTSRKELQWRKRFERPVESATGRCGPSTPGATTFMPS